MYPIDLKKDTFYGLGLMSGSSLDGLDMALCSFKPNPEAEELDDFLKNWKIVEATTVSYNDRWLKIFSTLQQADNFEYFLQHAAYGKWCGEQILKFLKSMDTQVDYVASHGHTIHHAPQKGFTVQMGCGATMAATCGIRVINDFRTMDVAMGGQGAPLAPLADLYLLDKDFDFFLNLGGIANISVRHSNQVLAYDICGANQTLNALANLLDLEYDESGKIAASGSLIPELLQEAMSIDYFSAPYPKSLSNDWVRQQQTQLFLDYPASVADRMNTGVELVAQLVAKEIQQLHKEYLPQKSHIRLVVTGGGAYNKYQMDRLAKACQNLIDIEVVQPPSELVEFKEAALMSFMGLLRLFNRPNCLSSVTGASQNAVGGIIHSV